MIDLHPKDRPDTDEHDPDCAEPGWLHHQPIRTDLGRVETCGGCTAVRTTRPAIERHRTRTRRG